MEFGQLNFLVPDGIATKGLFGYKKFLDFDTVVFLFLFDKHYPIID